MEDKEKLAYIAGFFDGEGSIVIRKHKKYKNKIYPQVILDFCQKDICVLLFIKNYLNCGHIYHIRKKGNSGEHWDYQITKKKDVFKVLSSLEPYLTIKKSKAQMVLNIYK
jgi:hypothetical protein